MGHADVQTSGPSSSLIWGLVFREPQGRKAGSLRPFCYVSKLTRTGGGRWRHMDQGAGIGVFQHPQRAIGAFFHIADALADIPALGALRSAMAVEDDPVERGGP